MRLKRVGSEVLGLLVRGDTDVAVEDSEGHASVHGERPDFGVEAVAQIRIREFLDDSLLERGVAVGRREPAIRGERLDETVAIVFAKDLESTFEELRYRHEQYDACSDGFEQSGAEHEACDDECVAYAESDGVSCCVAA